MQNNCTCSPLEDAFEDAFAQGLGAGLGWGNFKFFEMKLPIKDMGHSPHTSGSLVTKPMSYVAALHLVPN